jgi:uridine kinase
MERRDLLTQLTERIAAIHRDHPLRVAIDGVDAAGKTMLADELAGSLQTAGRPVIRATIDGFHNPAAIRRRRGTKSPEGYYRDSFNHDLLVEWLLQPLGPDGSRRYRRAAFDYRSDTPVDAPLETADADAVLLFDGVFLLRPELREYWDYSIFLRVDFAVTLQRALVRDRALFGSEEEIRARYRQRYIPGQQLYRTEARPERWATIVIDHNDPQNPEIVSG